MRQKKSNCKWTKKDKAMLVKCIKEGNSINHGCRIAAMELQRSSRACATQYYILRSDNQIDDNVLEDKTRQLSMSSDRVEKDINPVADITIEIQDNGVLITNSKGKVIKVTV